MPSEATRGGTVAAASAATAGIPAPDRRRDLAATPYLDHEQPELRAFVARAVGDAERRSEQLRRLFVAVRDEIRYDPYSLLTAPDEYRASVIAGREGAWCVPKAILLVAGCRALGIPARIGFADVRNHLTSERLRAMMGTDVFRWHGYAAIALADRWVKASPAFNRELCERFGVPPLDFDGENDALLHAYSGDGRRHMEYIADHGTFDEFPLERLLDVLRSSYPGIVAEPGLSEIDPSFR